MSKTLTLRHIRYEFCKCRNAGRWASKLEGWVDIFEFVLLSHSYSAQRITEMFNEFNV